MPPRLLTAIAAALLLAFPMLLPWAGPAGAAAFIDAAGRRVILPDRIGRILPAERNAEVLIYVLAPDRLAGMEAGAGRRSGVQRGVRTLSWRPRSTPESMAATAQQVRADLIVDAGAVTPDRAAFANAVQRLTGIPYVLIDSSFERTPLVLQSTGTILGVAGERLEDLRVFADHAITGLRGRLLIRPANTRPRVYYGLGNDGLTTPLPGSPAGAAIDEAGAINVAAPLGRGTHVRISREQLLAWDPQIIIAEKPSFYNSLRRNPALRRLSAVRGNKVYLEPSTPFGWIEDPAGVNRLIGLYWLSSLFYPDATQEDLRSTACDFYDKFYRIRLTNAQLDAMLRLAGAPPQESPRQLAEPLVGLGAAPSSTLPPGTPGTPTPAPTPVQANQTAPCTVPGAAAPIPGMYTAPSATAAPDAGAPGGLPTTPLSPGAAAPGRAGRAPAVPALPVR